MGIDLRSEFNKFLADFGYHVLLVRSGRRIRCSCWNDKTQEAKKDCVFCFGLGYVAQVEKHLIRSTMVSIPETLARAVKQTEFGRLAVPSRAYYFKYNVDPRTDDLVVDCRWDANGLPNLRDYNIYQINAVDDLRGDMGRIEYTKVYCGVEPVEKQIVAANVRKVGVHVVYDVGFRG